MKVKTPEYMNITGSSFFAVVSTEDEDLCLGVNDNASINSLAIVRDLAVFGTIATPEFLPLGDSSTIGKLGNVFSTLYVQDIKASKLTNVNEFGVEIESLIISNTSTIVVGPDTQEKYDYLTGTSGGITLYQGSDGSPAFISFRHCPANPWFAPENSSWRIESAFGESIGEEGLRIVHYSNDGSTQVSSYSYIEIDSSGRLFTPNGIRVHKIYPQYDSSTHSYLTTSIEGDLNISGQLYARSTQIDGGLSILGQLYARSTQIDGGLSVVNDLGVQGKITTLGRNTVELYPTGTIHEAPVGIGGVALACLDYDYLQILLDLHGPSTSDPWFYSTSSTPNGSLYYLGKDNADLPGTLYSSSGGVSTPHHLHSALFSVGSGFINKHLPTLPSSGSYRVLSGFIIPSSIGTLSSDHFAICLVVRVA